MKKSVMRINGVEYPSRMTMGAMMQFKELTGREVTELQGGDITLAVTLLYCCIVSACRVEGIPVPFHSPMEMADWMDADDFASWQNDQFTPASGEEPGTDEEKKKA